MTCRILKVFKIYLLFTLLLIGCSQVVQLTDANFNNFIQQNPYVLVKFYAPWCEHCKKMIPEYQKLAKLSDGKFKVAKLDGTTNNITMQTHAIEGYPTFKLFAKGIVVHYDSQRTAEDILKWVTGIIEAKIQTITQIELQQKIGKNNLVVVQGVSNEQKALLQLASATDLFVDYYYMESPIKRITLYLTNSQYYDYHGEITIQDIKKWAFKLSLPIIVPLNNKKNVRAVFQNEGKLPTLFLVKFEDFAKQSQAILQRFCKKHRQFICSYLEKGYQIYEGAAKYLKFSQKTSSLLYLNYEIKEGWSYPSSINEITIESLENFLKDIQEGKISKSIDAEKKEKEQQQQQQQTAAKKINYVNVLKLTNLNYNETIEKFKYVLIQYYTPKCRYCIKFAPQYEKLAKRLKDEDSGIVIAAVDMSVQKQINSQAQIYSFPTIRLFADGNQIQYQGERTVEKIIKFLEAIVISELETANSLTEIKKPAVAIFGVQSNSSLRYLPVLFHKYPVYLILEETNQFRVQLHVEQKIQIFNDTQATLSELNAWLNKLTEQTVVNIADDEAPKRLTEALSKYTPILAFIHRVDGGEETIKFLNNYCKNKLFICGVARKTDSQYETMNSWINDKNEEANVLVYINTKTFQRYFFKGELANITPKVIDQFIVKVNSGKIKAQKDPEQTIPEDPEDIEQQIRIQRINADKQTLEL